MKHKILITDDDLSIRTMLQKVLEKEGYSVITALDGEEGVELAASESPDLILLDLGLPGINGLEALRQIKKNDPDMAAIMITAEGSIESAVSAMKTGARNYITKPFNTDEIRLIVSETLETVRLRREVNILRSTQRDTFDPTQIITQSEAIKKVIRLSQRIAQSESTTVLIEGESGTGKEIIAKLIHYSGPRVDGPFVPINCGAIPKDLVESELFGSEKGAYTGAAQTRAGKFEAANNGTLFLDEVGELSLDNQIKLLRVLEEKSFFRLGGNKNIKVDVRIVAATNRDLHKAIEEGEFREDLYYRLNVAGIYIPPLRERQEDIIPLAEQFIREFCGTFGKPPLKIESEAEERFLTYAWKGNVRELRNTIERIVLLEDDDVLKGEHLDFLQPPRQSRRNVVQTPASHTTEPEAQSRTFKLPAEGVVLDELNKDLIQQALEVTGGNQVRAAKLLGLTRGTLRYRLDKYDIQE
ncbi:MAG: sigma-54-dependent Fis family transcriptional regulator [Candidatus Latescibacteria bacterium]|jgi:two-component system, NtrC family, response regulator AtoC|nr:sigma-54-dependent Fis family transcriptional regulator [Candidatus Latescibacterota bacterium]MBT5832469.1 sigma-54-dependent Fis family transcriptional regulator [Candidatus Latescibacterota bacterium]